MLQRILVLALLVIVVFVVPAVAQENAKDINPENVTPLEFDRPIVEYLCAGLFLVVALGIGFKPSKRVHDA